MKAFLENTGQQPSMLSTVF